jgi:hypothetical protein
VKAKHSPFGSIGSDGKAVHDKIKPIAGFVLPFFFIDVVLKAAWICGVQDGGLSRDFFLPTLSLFSYCRTTKKARNSESVSFLLGGYSLVNGALTDVIPNLAPHDRWEFHYRFMKRRCTFPGMPNEPPPAIAARLGRLEQRKDRKDIRRYMRSLRSRLKNPSAIKLTLPDDEPGLKQGRKMRRLEKVKNQEFEHGEKEMHKKVMEMHSLPAPDAAPLAKLGKRARKRLAAAERARATLASAPSESRPHETVASILGLESSLPSELSSAGAEDAADPLSQLEMAAASPLSSLDAHRKPEPASDQAVLPSASADDAAESSSDSSSLSSSSSDDSETEEDDDEEEEDGDGEKTGLGDAGAILASDPSDLISGSTLPTTSPESLDSIINSPLPSDPSDVEETGSADPEGETPDPEAVGSDSEAILAEPEAMLTEPEAVVTEPDFEADEDEKVMGAEASDMIVDPAESHDANISLLLETISDPAPSDAFADAVPLASALSSSSEILHPTVEPLAADKVLEEPEENAIASFDNAAVFINASYPPASSDAASDETDETGDANTAVLNWIREAQQDANRRREDKESQETSSTPESETPPQKKVRMFIMCLLMK